MGSEVLVGGAAAAVGTVAILAWRVQETRRPVTARKIIVPPLGMTTGFGMFVVPQLRVPLSWAACALAVGALVLAYPLMRSSRLMREGDKVMLQRGRAFLWILLGLVAVRWTARAYIGQLVSPTQTAAIFFLLAYGMIVRWRADMWLQYRALLAQAPAAVAAPHSAKP